MPRKILCDRNCYKRSPQFTGTFHVRVRCSPMNPNASGGVRYHEERTLHVSRKGHGTQGLNSRILVGRRVPTLSRTRKVSGSGKQNPASTLPGRRSKTQVATDLALKWALEGNLSIFSNYGLGLPLKAPKCSDDDSGVGVEKRQ